MADATIPLKFLSQAKVRPEGVAYCVKRDGQWRATSWKDHVAETRRAARALVSLGVGPGSTTAILGFNRPEWVVMALATMCTGAAPAGIYTTSSADEVQYIVDHARCTVILVENLAQWHKIHARREALPLLTRVVFMRGTTLDDPLALSWDDFLALGDAVPAEVVDERVAALTPSGLATLIYTSGTTGPPKGVMLSHQNLAWTATLAQSLVQGRPTDVSLSYLPLSHIAEQMFTVHGPCVIGHTIYYAESIERVADNLREVQPTVFFGVPRIWEKLHAGITAKLRDTKGAKAKIVTWAMAVGRAYHTTLNDGRAVSWMLKAQHALASRVLYQKVRTAVGFGRARACVSGAAPVEADVLGFFMGIDLPIREVYGQSEGTGPTSFNVPGRTRIGTVGPPLPGVEVKIADDGEILVKGPNVFMGYFREPEATAETLRDGWLHSGDLGTFDPDGYLCITGRKKEILITSGGKNITPKNIEGALKSHPLIGEAVLIGDRRKYLTALVTLDPEAATRFATEKGVSAPPHEAVEVRAAIQEAVDDVNATLARVETVKKFTILPAPFSIEAGELTPTLKVKRRRVHERYATEIEAMYAD